jgi:predicted esterase
MTRVASDPHSGQPILRFGPEIPRARLAALMLHGRGGSAEDMLALAGDLGTDDVAYLAPQAAGHTWYPHSFLAPIEQNEPHLSSALAAVSSAIAALAQHGIGPDRIVLLGFSQGACLALEFAASHARRYAAVVGLSGGVIGPPSLSRKYEGSMKGTPVFVGCSDVDPHIPVDRVHETTEVFRGLGASVDERIYPGMGHTVNRDELGAVRALLGVRAR